MTTQLNTVKFIERAKKVHGDKYDYSKVDYKSSKDCVTIICPIHGEFEQKAGYHLKSKGCPYCAGKIDTKEFIRRAREIHGDKYDYSKVIYTKSKEKVIIICPIHGEFEQMADNHLRGSGCPKCAGTEKKTTEQFIQEAIKIHGIRYDYSKVNYINANTKVCIICPEHGEFWQEPHSHLNGNGCGKCVGKGFTTEEFIEKARKIHGNKYDYSKVDYKGAKIKVCIICPRCGEFWQTPDSHLNRGSGCNICNLAMTTEEFIKKANSVHNYTYDYSKTEYTRTHNKVCIICPKHGEFWQTPNGHLGGDGCPKCRYEKLLSRDVSNGELDVMSVLDKWGIVYETQVPVPSKVNQFGIMYVDFYIPEYNTFIEYNGQQHYMPIELMGGQLKFEQQQARDEELRQYCKDNNINLIEIRYDEDVWEVLNEKLCR